MEKENIENLMWGFKTTKAAIICCKWVTDGGTRLRICVEFPFNRKRNKLKIEKKIALWEMENHC